MFAELPREWRDAYDAGIFTEFMEQRAPGHLDQHLLPFYEQGLADGSSRSSEVSHILLDIVDEMALLQPSTRDSEPCRIHGDGRIEGLTIQGGACLLSPGRKA